MEKYVNVYHIITEKLWKLRESPLARKSTSGRGWGWTIQLFTTTQGGEGASTDHAHLSPLPLGVGSQAMPMVFLDFLPTFVVHFPLDSRMADPGGGGAVTVCLSGKM